MTTQTLVRNLQKEVKTLKKEVARLGAAVFNIPEDDEGEYKPQFIKEVLRAAKQKPKKLYEYKKPGDLLKHLRSFS
jgi:hypothetical protein